jgi:DNA-binding NtrC family response regulator
VAILYIFVLEYSRVAAEIRAEVLRFHGYSAIAFSNSKEMLAAASKGTAPGLLIADLLIGDIPTTDMALQIHQSCPHCRLMILTSGTHMPHCLAVLPQAGIPFSFYFKPLAPENLLRAVRLSLDCTTDPSTRRQSIQKKDERLA